MKTIYLGRTIRNRCPRCGESPLFSKICSTTMKVFLLRIQIQSEMVFIGGIPIEITP